MAAGRTYEPIATTTLNTTTTSYTFNSIPNTYTDLVIIASCVAPSGGAARAIAVRINGDTSQSYSQTFLWNGDGTLNSSRNVNLTYVQAGYYAYFTGTQRSLSQINIFRANSNDEGIAKTMINRSSSVTGTDVFVGTWSGTTRVSSITLITQSGDFGSGTILTLYGIKAA